MTESSTPLPGGPTGVDANPSFLEAAQRALARGQSAEAIALCESVLSHQPRNFYALMIWGQALARARRLVEATIAFDRASEANPGHAAPFTLNALLRFRMAFGAPPLPANPGSGGRVQFRQLGTAGRFGNQLLQYGFLRLYAKRYGLVAECPDWIGRDLYDLSDPLPSCDLPTLGEDEVDWLGSLRGTTGLVHSNTDIMGFFAGSTTAWGEVKNDFRDLYVLGMRVAPAIRNALARLRQMGDSLVAIHLRRGDFGYGRFWIAPVNWYLNWLRPIWPTLTRPVLYVATDEPTIADELAEFHPVQSHHLKIEIPGADFLVDHEVLRAADLLAISNSTFSFTAAMLNTSARTFVRPIPEREQLDLFEPWNSKVLLDWSEPPQRFRGGSR
jgi:hypothetical protein